MVSSCLLAPDCGRLFLVLITTTLSTTKATVTASTWCEKGIANEIPLLFKEQADEINHPMRLVFQKSVNNGHANALKRLQTENKRLQAVSFLLNVLQKGRGCGYKGLRSAVKGQSSQIR